MVNRYCVEKVVDLQIFEVGAFQNELLQWPLLEAILVREPLDCKPLKTLLCVDGASKYVNKRVQHV